MLIVSLLAMVVCAGAFALVYVRADTRVQVLAVTRAVAAGQTIAVADLRVVRVVPDAGVALVPASRASQVIGATAVVPLAAGSLLTESQLGPAAWPPSGQAVVAIPVKAGRIASGVTPGVRVLVIPVAKEGDPQPAPSASGAPAPVKATVVRVAATDGAGSFVVSLLVARADAVRVAGAAGDMSIAVAQD
ncbi:SAF domain-containing protein [Micromonospora sp. WMMD1082]|uniref:SAF domain-containing protein n=1 Tax=Micromonospora sp. WMMD1082 TaxID=3016104 RepID=UPI002417938E|nr:SAF domain-containing protein [Micromonospora sp. WMMD1082]MDG4793617.1 SAF domain-containing protein [Micromonospora sp. WMMD1082]